MAVILEKTYVRDLVENKGLLISAPVNTTVEQVLKIMAENGITAVPVASGSEQWTSQEETPINKSTRYIGIVSVFDVVLHIGEKLSDAENSLQTTVVDIIVQSNESRLLWTVDPNTRLIDAMEFLCKGVHRFLVPVNEYHETPYPHETTQFRLLTQTDVVGFLLLHMDEMGPCVMRTVSELGLLDPNLVALAIPSNMTLMAALRLMHHKPVFSSFAVIEPEEEEACSDTHPSWGCGGKLVGSLSATHFRGMGFEDIKMLKPETTVAEFFKMLASKSLTRPLVTVRPNTPLASVMGAAITNKVHRVWVTDENGWLMGVVSFSDIIGAVRRSPTSFAER
ncbi:SNF1-related protein kinase regulatory subunit gamma-like PV42b [Cryptomeria japonica]|uniref:SNF1-related protein kinase regulatory subunit gamma-like PV42b n=1 Tax=Cryptomeria japonica TaxID=3369 RepID=UPI0025AD05D3|nr:SNF1-related protein kinase regulatory subunit gamma-like PV42b [Cryptomeria japonica]